MQKRYVCVISEYNITKVKGIKHPEIDWKVDPAVSFLEDRCALVDRHTEKCIGFYSLTELLQNLELS